MLTIDDAKRLEDLEAFTLECALEGPCGGCKGTGESSYADDAGRKFRCTYCGGRKVIEGFDFKEIFMACFTLDKKTGKPKRFRTSAPKHDDHIKCTRMRYVWRWARFHGGADVTLPMMFTSTQRYDPRCKELDIMASVLALMVFGSDRAATYRWGRLLVDPTLPEYPPGQPMSASSNHDPCPIPETKDEGE